MNKADRFIKYELPEDKEVVFQEYNCPICGWETPTDDLYRYIIINENNKHGVLILEDFWIDNYDGRGTMIPNLSIVNDESTNDPRITKYIHIETGKAVYPICKNGRDECDYYSGVSYQSWIEVHCCPIHGEFEFENSTA